MARLFSSTLYNAYSLSPLGLPLKCVECSGDFSINQPRFEIFRHDEVTTELIELGTMALRPDAVWKESLINALPKQKDPTQTNNPYTTIIPPVVSSSEDCGRTNVKR
jgi:hypothetical protein